MSRKRGRSARQYRLRVRTERRDPIDYSALARAALEQAAMDQASEAGTADSPWSPPPNPNDGRNDRTSAKEVLRDRLA